VARISPLRVYINVPQAFTPLVKPGAEVDLKLNEFPGRIFPARVTNAAVAIDTVSRAMLVELQYPNERGELLPGAYAQATIKLTGATGLYTTPANAMLFRADGTTVGVVHPDGKVEIRKINITLNDGNSLQIAGGLTEADEVIVNPSDGMTVKVLVPKQPAPAQSPASSG
jgi:RND family efflux transporter MFP subunit